MDEIEASSVKDHHSTKTLRSLFELMEERRNAHFQRFLFTEKTNNEAFDLQIQMQQILQQVICCLVSFRINSLIQFNSMICFDLFCFCFVLFCFVLFAWCVIWNGTATKLKASNTEDRNNGPLIMQIDRAWN